ncbi:hypothetical protein F5877DRAFT_85666 [Lentinula edodes]|nr:hypothetical protein F5877DRAFT_85666 [Lentinula edodes]
MHAQGPRSPVSSTSPTVMRQRREALYPHNKPPPKLDLFSFNEDEDGTLAETIGNLHGRLEFSGPTEKGIRSIGWESENDTCGKRPLGGDFFFNGGNTMHQEIKSPVSDVEAFLTQIGCKFSQTIAPFYDMPPNVTKEGKSSRGGPIRGGQERGRSTAATSNLEPQPNLRLQYIGLNTAFIRIDSPPIRDTLLRLQTFALSRLLAFHIVPINTECHLFVVCLIYSMALDKDDITSRRMLYSIKQKLRDNNTVFSNLLAPLSKTARSMQHKVHSFVSSMDIMSRSGRGGMTSRAGKRSD